VYNSLCRRKRRSHKKTVANKVTNLIEARNIQVFETSVITPADIAIPPGPGVRYRKGSDTNTFLQQRPDQPPLYNIPVETLLSTHIEQSLARMNTSSSPGFDPFPSLFFKRAETEFMDERGKAQRANVLLQLLTDLFKLLLRDGGLEKKSHPSTRNLNSLSLRTIG